MAMKGYSTLPGATGLKSYHQMQFRFLPWTLFLERDLTPLCSIYSQQQGGWLFLSKLSGFLIMKPQHNQKCIRLHYALVFMYSPRVLNFSKVIFQFNILHGHSPVWCAPIEYCFLYIPKFGVKRGGKNYKVLFFSYLFIYLWRKRILSF